MDGAKDKGKDLWSKAKKQYKKGKKKAKERLSMDGQVHKGYKVCAAG